MQSRPPGVSCMQKQQRVLHFADTDTCILSAEDTIQRHCKRRPHAATAAAIPRAKTKFRHCKTGKHTGTQTGKLTGKHTGMQTGKHTGMQTGKHTSRSKSRTSCRSSPMPLSLRAFWRRSPFPGFRSFCQVTARLPAGDVGHRAARFWPRCWRSFRRQSPRAAGRTARQPRNRAPQSSYLAWRQANNFKPCARSALGGYCAKTVSGRRSLS